jgi:hypothetical protein
MKIRIDGDTYYGVLGALALAALFLSSAFVYVTINAEQDSGALIGKGFNSGAIVLQATFVERLRGTLDLRVSAPPIPEPFSVDTSLKGDRLDRRPRSVDTHVPPGCEPAVSTIGSLPLSKIPVRCQS